MTAPRQEALTIKAITVSRVDREHSDMDIDLQTAESFMRVPLTVSIRLKAEDAYRLANAIIGSIQRSIG